MSEGSKEVTWGEVKKMQVCWVISQLLPVNLSRQMIREGKKERQWPGDIIFDGQVTEPVIHLKRIRNSRGSWGRGKWHEQWSILDACDSVVGINVKVLVLGQEIIGIFNI